MSTDVRRREHWQQAWTSKPDTATSWYQPRPDVSLALIAAKLAFGEGFSGVRG